MFFFQHLAEFDVIKLIIWEFCKIYLAMIAITVFRSKLTSTIFISGWCLTLHFISIVQDLVPIPNLHANFAQGFHVHYTHKLFNNLNM